MFTLQDVWPLLGPAFDRIKDLRYLCWTPVDHDPVPPRVADSLRQSGVWPVAMSRFGERAMRDLGLDPLYAPHGINTSLFRPMDFFLEDMII